MNKVLAIGISTLAVAGVAAAVTNMNASALVSESGVNYSRQGYGNGYQTSLESRASVVGMTADELKAALETKTMSEIAVEKGLSEEAFRAKMIKESTARWSARGLSEEEIAKRMSDREARHSENSADHEFGSGDGNHRGGYGKNRQ